MNNNLQQLRRYLRLKLPHTSDNMIRAMSDVMLGGHWANTARKYGVTQSGISRGLQRLRLKERIMGES